MHKDALNVIARCIPFLLTKKCVALVSRLLWYSWWIKPLKNPAVTPLWLCHYKEGDISTLKKRNILTHFMQDCSVSPWVLSYDLCVYRCDCFCIHLYVNACARVHNAMRLASYSYCKLRYSKSVAGKWCIWVTFEVSATACWIYTQAVPHMSTAVLQDVMYSALYHSTSPDKWQMTAAVSPRKIKSKSHSSSTSNLFICSNTN